MSISVRARIVAALAVLFAFSPLLAYADTELFTSDKNPGFETGSTGWTQGSPAGITASYSVIAGGHTGSAGNISVTGVTNGEAKWLSPFFTVTPGQVLTFSNWYKSNVLTSVFVYPSGPVAPSWIGDAATSSAAFSQFHGQSYLVPPGVTSIQIGHAISKVGTLATDDNSLSLSSAPTAFAQGIVTFTFDDGWQSFWDVASTSLNAHNFKATNYIITGVDGSNVGTDVPNTDYMSRDEITKLSAASYDVQPHTRAHLDLAKDDPAAHGYPAGRDSMWAGEITGSINDLKGLLPATTIDSFAYPYGSYCAPTLADCSSTTVQNSGAVNVMTAVKNANGGNTIKAARSVDDGYAIAGDLTSDNAYKLKTKSIKNTTTAAEVQSWINFARDNKVWLIIMFHNVRPAGTSTVYATGAQNPKCIEPRLNAQGQEIPGQFQQDTDCTTSEVLKSASDYLATQSTVSVLTMHQVLTSQVPVVISSHADVFAEATSTAGANVTYTNPTVTGSATVTCTPASGTNFAMGSTTVTCSATGATNTTFTVGVRDTTKPVVTLNGSTPVALIVGDAYTELGATATDAVTPALTVSTSVTLGGTATTSVNTGVIGTYIVKYSATDLAGNVGSTTRTVTVSDKPAPIISAQSNRTPAETSITVTWTTDHPATSRVVWGTASVIDASSTQAGAPNYGYANSTTEDAALVTNHSVTLTGLSAATQYFFRAVSHGSPEAVGPEQNATTASTPASNGGGSTGGSNGNGSNGGGGNGPVAGSIGGGGGGGSGFYFTPAPDGSTSANGSNGSTGGNGQVLGASAFRFTRDLWKGMRDGDVMELQKRLAAEGFLVIDSPTNYYGNLTVAAVMAYQKAHALAQVGRVGPMTRAALNGEMGGAISNSDKAALIAALQAKLKELMDKIAALMAAGGSSSKSGTASSTPATTSSTSTPSTASSTSMMMASSTATTTSSM